MIETIENNYNLRLYKKTMCTIDGYSYISRVSTDIGDIFIKEIKNECDYIYLLEKIYNELSKKSISNVPLLTKSNKYICSSTNNKFVIFMEVNESNEVPTALWWANVLHEIHSISVEDNVGYFMPGTYFSLNHSLFLNSLQYIPKDIEKLINDMLQLVRCTSERKVTRVINHGDPLRSNVMKKNERFILIDFENACIAPKEYDLQRHLWDFAINASKSEIVNYCINFTNEYQIYDAIDFELLHDFFILDFCRTLCWLYVVCNDYKRSDLKRQQYELKKFITAIKTKKVNEILDWLRREL